MVDLNEAPFEVMYGPCEVYVNAAADTAIPVLGAVVSTAALGTGWVLLGKAGIDNMPDGGLTFAGSTTYATWTPISRVLPTKVRRTAQEMHVTFALADFTVENMGIICDDDGDLLDDNAAAPTTVGYREIRLELAPNVQEYSLLVRFNQSPYALGSAFTAVWRSQVYFPRAYNTGNWSLQFQKGGDPAMTAYDFMPLSDASSTRKNVYQAVDAGKTMA
jgi:hypothetical protein